MPSGYWFSTKLKLMILQCFKLCFNVNRDKIRLFLKFDRFTRGHVFFHVLIVSVAEPGGTGLVGSGVWEGGQ